MKLTWHAYRYYPYERLLALREATALLGPDNVREMDEGVEVVGGTQLEQAQRLVYFSQIRHRQMVTETFQARLERIATIGRSRQATRYSVHGLHEYKGKFNPQVAKAILNIFAIRPGDQVLDPFCGSGTTLVECAHMGARGIGTDINPLAVFIANAKLHALAVPVVELRRFLGQIAVSLNRTRRWTAAGLYDDRGKYLRSWFDADILGVVETVRHRIQTLAGERAPIFLAIASNLLRDYSQQDPNDLRIRRRKSPLPSAPFHEVFLAAAQSFLERLAETQSVLGTEFARGEAALRDVTDTATLPTRQFDAALTSPPYAMALPYIDTQRLSLVWLGLLPPEQILRLEADLIGSREIRGRERRELVARVGDNTDQLPAEQLTFCRGLQDRLGAGDGFRRQAVPFLLYRYFVDMQASFRALRSQVKVGAPYALIVGHNHTILGGVRQDIDTPQHLAALAIHAGWQLDEVIELQTYQRYGYHMSNAVSAESLIVLRNR